MATKKATRAKLPSPALQDAGETATDIDLGIMARVKFKALMSKNQVLESEAKYDDTWGYKRRLAMLTLTRSREQLMEGLKEHEVMLEMLGHITEYQQHLNAALKLTDAALARLMSVASSTILAGKEGGAA